MDFLPLFPLSMVAFPGEEVRLHIFEPRYKQMINDCFTRETAFGIAPYFEGKSLELGTEMMVSQIVKRYPDGKMDIKAVGTGWFTIIEFKKVADGKLCPGGFINRMPWSDDNDPQLNVTLTGLIRELYSVMNIINVTIPDPADFRTWDLIHKIGLSSEQEMELLQIPKESEKQKYLITHLNHLLPIVRESEKIRKRAELNGHFQYLDPLL